MQLVVRQRAAELIHGAVLVARLEMCHQDTGTVLELGQVRRQQARAVMPRVLRQGTLLVGKADLDDERLYGSRVIERGPE